MTCSLYWVGILALGLLPIGCSTEAGGAHAAPTPHGARGQVTLRVIDSIGNPVDKAHLSVAFWKSDSSADVVVSEGTTDLKGLFVATGNTIHSMNYTFTKEGSYETHGTYWFYPGSGRTVVEGRWQPWNPTVAVVLKERRNPIPMFARKVDVNIPARDKAVGFDLEKFDWVPPYGSGIRADIMFEYVAKYTGPQDFSKQLVITCSHPQDGLQTFSLEKTSEFMSSYTAPQYGYSPQYVQKRERTRTKIIKSMELGENQYLLLRVRTVTDKEDKIVSANYGKIYGPIEYGRMGDRDRLMFTSYFNPAANDQNLEFNPQRNLYVGEDRRRVYQP